MKSIEFNIYFEEEIPISIVKTFFILKTTKVTVGEKKQTKIHICKQNVHGDWMVFDSSHLWGSGSNEARNSDKLKLCGCFSFLPAQDWR